MTCQIISLADRRRARAEARLVSHAVDIMLMPYRGWVMVGLASAAWAVVLAPWWWPR